MAITPKVLEKTVAVLLFHSKARHRIKNARRSILVEARGAFYIQHAGYMQVLPLKRR